MVSPSPSTTRRGVLGLSAAAMIGATLRTANAAPEGELRIGVHVSLAPTWFDPAETPGIITPFMLLYAMHDAILKAMPGDPMAPCLAESCTMSSDGLSYALALRKGVKFHNGEELTAEDVKFSLERYRGAAAKSLKDRVANVEIHDPHRLTIRLKEPWPDFLTFYGTMVAGAGWIVPRKYVEQVGDDGFKKRPVGLGPYKFVSHTPGVELVLEAFEGYWRKVPSVKRLVFKSVPEATTRFAMLKRGEIDVAYLLDVPQAQELKRDPSFKVAFSGGIASFYLDYFDMWDPKSPWADRRVRLAASHAIDRRALNEAETLGQSRPNGGFVPRNLEFALPLEAHAYDPATAKQLLAEAGYPQGFDAGDLHPFPPYTSVGEAVAGYLQAVGIRTRIRTMERAAFIAEWGAKKLRGLCVCTVGVYGNAASRMSQYVPSTGTYAYGGWPDVDALYEQQAREVDRRKREALLHQIQKTIYERVRFGMIYDYVWPSGVGPRVAEPALLLIDPYPWAAPYEELRLKPGR